MGDICQLCIRRLAFDVKGLKQLANSDIAGGNWGGKLSKAHRTAKGGSAKGLSSGNLIGKVGGSTW